MSGSALAELCEALGELGEALYIEKLPINRPSGRYVIDPLEYISTLMSSDSDCAPLCGSSLADVVGGSDDLELDDVAPLCWSSLAGVVGGGDDLDLDDVGDDKGGNCSGSPEVSLNGVTRARGFLNLLL